MSLKDQLKEDMKAAMKAREEGKTALSVIRMVNSAIKNTEINDKIELDDAGIFGILAKEMKTRQDSDVYKRQLAILLMVVVYVQQW